ncbi:hypothetical protein EGN72_04840 [Pseudorhodobacter sp. E13]|uniref:hypothetical protein n=1 Tax=Pseudorhodobacter sp. E13 TaxID=2487931 RepID=UPI000F8D8804|nr:hypothetical protein [Pseudorhodobacter sp. E13]RUS63326.1 hypothetical protein EGN72_04840 [Pseudorhodobacter sp. E13]
MRVISLFGLGIPVLAVSGAVAYGSIREISRSLAPAPVAESRLSNFGHPAQGAAARTQAALTQVAPQAAQSFVAAGQTAWDMPQPATFQAPRFTDDPLSPARIVALSGPVPEGQGREASPAYGQIVVEEAAAGSFGTARKPRVVVTAKPRADRPRAAVENRVKRPFKMPWQTGIFQ